MGMPITTLPPESEAGFQRVVIDLARRCGWVVAHFRASLARSGKWATAVQGDGAGFPDLVLVHPCWHQTLFVELKSERGRVRPEQELWLEALREAGQQAMVWRPSMWGVIEQTLMGGGQ